MIDMQNYKTQMEAAKMGIITTAMEAVAKKSIWNLKGSENMWQRAR